MNLGFFLPHLAGAAMEALAVKAESLGFDFLCCDDHLISPFETRGTGLGGCHEAWTAMTFLAGRTRTIRLGHMALVPSFRGPAVLAKMASTLDLLSGGRLILTLGAGWYRREFEAYGIPWEGHRERIHREREAVRIIRSLWTEERVTVKGRFYSLTEATLDPKPSQKPSPPIWIAGDSRPSMELAAELGDGWLMHGHSPEEIGRMIGKIRPMLGPKSGAFAFGTALFLVMASGREEATRKLKTLIPPEVWERFMGARIRQEIRNRVSGSPDECLSRLWEYADAGVTDLILIFPDPQDVDRFAADVLPRLQRS